ncbi:MAG: nucleotidyltransferase domain-containing protein [Promethearchaeota archaeon]
MKWLPRWLGESYTHLWREFGQNLFYFDDARKVLKQQNIYSILSELKRNQALHVFHRKNKKRLYRLLSPMLYFHGVSRGINLGWLKQGVYFNLIAEVVKTFDLTSGVKLKGMGVFGSVARGTASARSDIDVIMVMEELPNSLGKRLDLAASLLDTKDIRDELDFLSAFSCNVRVMPHLIKPEELSLNPFTIDIGMDLKIVLDDGTLEKFLVDVRSYIIQHGVKRVKIGKSDYYLDLNIPFGEVRTF